MYDGDVLKMNLTFTFIDSAQGICEAYFTVSCHCGNFHLGLCFTNFKIRGLGHYKQTQQISNDANVTQ